MGSWALMHGARHLNPISISLTVGYSPALAGAGE